MIELKYKFKSIEQRGNELIATYEIAMPEESETTICPICYATEENLLMRSIPKYIRNQITKRKIEEFLEDTKKLYASVKEVPLLMEFEDWLDKGGE